MREAPRHVGREADLAQKLGDAVARLALRGKPVDDDRLGDRGADALARIEARERILEIICMRWRMRRSPCGSSARTSLPSNRTRPAFGSTSRRIERPVVDLPQPLSPTSASVSPACSEKETSSTACTRALTLPKTPERMGKRVTRFATSRIGRLAGAPCATLSSPVSRRRHAAAPPRQPELRRAGV